MTLFFVPARIPQDSSGFLFFPEEFFHSRGVPQSSRPGFSESSGITPHNVGEEKCEESKAKTAILAKIDFGPLAHRYPHLEYRLL